MNPTLPWVLLGALSLVTAALILSSRSAAKARTLLQAKIAAGARVLDVRTPGEYAAGHYPAALSLPLDTLAQHLASLQPFDQPLIVYCSTGRRSAHARALLQVAGFTDVTNAGGLANLPAGS